MNIYYCNKEVLEDGTIIYKKENLLTDDYDVIEKNNTIILKPKKKTIKIKSVDELNKYNFATSVIFECYINGKKLIKNKYAFILDYIYKLIGDGAKIIKNTSINLKTTKIINKGFHYCQELSISVPSVDSNNAFEEIVGQCLKNNLLLDIEIKLSDDKIIIFKT